MIRSLEDYRFYLLADEVALNRPRRSVANRIKSWLFPDLILRFQVLMRTLEYVTNTKRSVWYLPYKTYLSYRYHRLSVRLGFTIPINTFGPGLSIAHYGTIVINRGAKVGANCRLHAGVNIGTKAGYANVAPVLGDNIYLGPGAKLFGEIVLGSNLAIGANAVVTKSFTEEGVALGGVPAKVISPVRIQDMVIDAAGIAKSGIDRRPFQGKPAKEIADWLQSHSS